MTGYAESFHSRLVDEFLSQERFEHLRLACLLTAAWREDNNHQRPDGRLGYLPPAEFAAGCGAISAPVAAALRSRHNRFPTEGEDLPHTVLA